MDNSKRSFRARAVVRVGTSFAYTEKLLDLNGGSFRFCGHRCQFVTRMEEVVPKSGRLTLVTKMQRYLYTHTSPPSWICDRAKLLV